MIKDNFFVIASDSNLCALENKLYGYAYFNHKLFHNSYVTNRDICERPLDAVGAYVIISRKSDTIEIISDCMGNEMIFYYNTKDFFAVSNSFYMLVQYLKSRVIITLDESYASLFTVTNSIVTCHHERTLVNEIKLLHIDEKISINICNNTLKIEKAYERNKKVKINTIQGLTLLDSWADKWVKIIRTIVDCNQQVNLQLSGGFDSRVTLALFLLAGIDFRKINVESSTRMKEDFEIAGKIADYYGFKLNQKYDFESINVPDEEVFNMQIFNRLGLHQEYLAPVNKYFNRPLFTFTGLGSAHSWYEDSTNKYTQRMQLGTNNEIAKKCIKDILDEMYAYINNYHGTPLPANKNFMNYAYIFTRNRYNVGTSMVHKSCNNEFLFSPLQDYLFNLIDPIYEGNDDFNLLAAITFQRYAENLLNFPINENRKIKPETILEAEKINSISALPCFISERKDNYIEIIGNYMMRQGSAELNSINKNKLLSDLLLKNREKYEKQGFADKSLINKAIDDLENSIRHNERKAFSLLSVIEILKACEESSYQSISQFDFINSRQFE